MQARHLNKLWLLSGLSQSAFCLVDLTYRAAALRRILAAFLNGFN